MPTLKNGTTHCEVSAFFNAMVKRFGEYLTVLIAQEVSYNTPILLWILLMAVVFESLHIKAFGIMDSICTLVSTFL